MQTEKAPPFPPQSLWNYQSLPFSDSLVISSSAVCDTCASFPSYGNNYTNTETMAPKLELELFLHYFRIVLL